MNNRRLFPSPSSLTTSTTLDDNDNNSTSTLKIQNLIYNMNMKISNKNNVNTNDSNSDSVGDVGDENGSSSSSTINRDLVSSLVKYKQNHSKSSEMLNNRSNGSSGRLGEINKVLQMVQEQIENKVKYYSDMYDNQTMRFIKIFKQKQLIIMDSKKKRSAAGGGDLSFYLMKMVVQCRNEGNGSSSNGTMDEQLGNLYKKFNKLLVGNCRKCLNYLEHYTLENLIVHFVIENNEFDEFQSSSGGGESLVSSSSSDPTQLPTLSPLLIDFTNSEILKHISKQREDGGGDGESNNPFIRKDQLVKFIDSLLDLHLKDSLRFADPFIESNFNKK